MNKTIHRRGSQICSCTFVRSFGAKECLSRKCLPIDEEERNNFYVFQHTGEDGGMYIFTVSIFTIHLIITEVWLKRL